MLRIESYITPIILSYVDKYIKNLKPEDSQVSLWGGDAVFNNLDLRLEVLEKELNLPFSFVNGHIHELRIHVPWTKLTSEPIVITINTIECILKLKGAESGESDSSSQSSLASKSIERRKTRKQVIEAPTSYIQGLINRIINNVSIVCNNVILKYVEDDIVLSINVKTLELRSVDGNWIPAFIDLSAEDLILRKLVTLTDLTVCLDRRNASGKIEVYQEPLLYRCSLSCRVVRQFETTNSTLPLITRYDVYCPQLHFSLSDSQLPMILRLVQLILVLYYGELGTPQPQEQDEHVSPEAYPTEDSSDLQEGEIGDSWSSWAWSIGSAVLPIYWEEDEAAKSAHKYRFKKTLHLGIYVETATWTFKLTETMQDSGYFGPTKMRFTPFLRFEQQGSFLTTVVRGIVACNVKLGISSLTCEPLNHCICGMFDAHKDPDSDDVNTSSGDITSYLAVGMKGQEYLSNSLFDPEVLVEGKELWDYIYSWDQHAHDTTEASLLAHTGAVAIDYFYYLELPDEMSSDQLSQISTDLEYSNMSERAICRIFIGSSEVNLNSGCYHRLQAVDYALRQYDYPPYTTAPSDDPLRNMSVPSSDEVSSLESNTPLRTILLTVMEPTLVFHNAQHQQINMKNIANAKRRKKNKKASGEVCMARVLPVPCVRVKVSRFEVEWTKAMYPARLVKTACMLRPPSETMLNNCHSQLHFRAVNLCIGMQYKNSIVALVQKFSPTFYCKTLLLPTYWSSPHQPRTEHFFQADSLAVEASAPQLILLHRVLTSWQKKQPTPELLQKDSLLEDALNNKRLPVLSVVLAHSEAKMCDTASLYGMMATLGSINVALRRPSGDLLCLLISGPEDKIALEVHLKDTLSISDKLMKIALQYPKKLSDESVPSVLTIGLKKMAILLDPQLIQWLKYIPHKVNDDSFIEMVFLKKISDVRGTTKSQRKPSDVGSEVKLETSTTTTSEVRSRSVFSRQETLVEDTATLTWKEQFITWYPFLNHLLINVDLDTTTIFFTTSSLHVASETGLVNAVHRTYLTRSEHSGTLGDALVVCLPHVVLHNAQQKSSLLHTIQDVPAILPSDIWTPGKDKLPWALSMLGFSIYSLQGSGQHVKLQVLKPVNTTATLAITTKHQGPNLTQLGLVIHTDMSTLDFCGSRPQVASHVTILQNLLSLVDFINSKLETGRENKPLASGGLASTLAEETVPTTATSLQTPSQHLPHHPDAPATQPRLTHNSTSDPNTILVTDTDDIDEERVQVVSETEVSTNGRPIVTAWVQWTVERVSASLYANAGLEQRKLRAEMEELTIALDLHHVYSKAKVKVSTVNIMHFVKKKNAWVAGEYEGIIMTCLERLTRDLKVINPKLGTVEPHFSGGRMNSNSPIEAHPGKPRPDHGFLCLTFTTALCKNVHNTWNTLIKKNMGDDRCINSEKPSGHYLSEVDIRLQPLDCVVYLESLHIFVSVYEPWLQIQLPKQLMTSQKTHQNSPPLGLAINNHTLPLIYLHTECLRLFLPTTCDNNEDESDHNMFVMQIESIIVSPQVDNPLSRIMIRPNIFHMAEQAKILGVPGSQVEDRQYQLDVQDFSATTGCWSELLKSVGGRPKTCSSERLRVMGENPALEWNNYDPSQETKEVNIVLHPFISRFDIRMIGAPAIVYRGETCGGENTLVAGHSLEVNATSDVDLHVSLPQVKLLEKIVYNTTSLIKQVIESGSSRKTVTASQDVTDSGVDCDMSSVEMLRAKQYNVNGAPSETSVTNAVISTFVPIELLLTGAKITVTVFDRGIIEDHQRTSIKGCQRSKLSQRARKREQELAAVEGGSTESEHSLKHSWTQPSKSKIVTHNTMTTPDEIKLEEGYEGSEEGSTCEGLSVVSVGPRIMPLVYLVLSQPHAFLSCQPNKQKLDISCFDAIVKSVPEGFSLKVCESKKIPNSEDYTVSWLETRPGDPHPKTGIPPTLFLLSAIDFLHKPGCVSLEIGRPVRFCLSESRLQQVEHVVTSLLKVVPGPQITEEKYFEKQGHISHVEMSVPEKLRQMLMHLENISMLTSQVVVNCEILKPGKAKSEVHFSVSKIKLNIGTSRKRSLQNLSGSPSGEIIYEIITASEVTDLQIKTSYHSQKLHSFLRPWTVSGEIKLLWLQWSRKPYLEMRLDTDSISVDFGPEHELCFKDLINHINIFLLKQNWQPSNEKPLINLKTKETKEEIHNDILYQDDLRAGIFQYVSLALEDPKPYQVVFDKMAGTMVWCYPEPRTLTRVDIYPVPFVAASEFDTNDDGSDRNQVLCALQYYDALRETFITYRQFQLSESKFCQLDLPSFHEKQHLAVSSMWRVCIDYREEDYSCSEEGGHGLVSPAALAACMRVDSMFSVDTLATTQLVINLGQMQLTLYNHLALTGKKLPHDMIFFNLDVLAPEEQSFLTFTIENTCVRSYKWKNASHLKLIGSMRMDVLSYSFLTNSCLLEPTFIESSFVLQDAAGPDKPSVMDSVLTVKPMMIHVNQSTIHTLNVAQESWNQVTQSVSDVEAGPNLSVIKKAPFIFMTNYIICNDTIDTIRFGQVSTDESVLLESRCIHLYCWRSHKMAPQLQVCVEGGRWKWCDSFTLDYEGTQVRSISQDNQTLHLLIIIEKLSPSQKKVTFSGLVSVANLLNDDLELRVIETNKERDSPKHGGVYALRSHYIAPSYIGEAHGIRIRLLGTQTVWSGEIPLALERTKESLLVKLPLKMKGEHLLVWSRVVRQRIMNVWRLLLVISPQYVVRSHLPRPIILHVNTPSTHVSHQVMLRGRGNMHTLSVDSSVVHHLTFQLSPDLEVSSPPIPLTRTMADQMSASQNVEAVNICKSMRELFHGPAERWPYVNNMDFQGDVLFADQPKIDLQVGFSGLNVQCNTLVVDVRPWALVVNHTCMEVVLQEGDPKNLWFVPSGAVFAPPKLDASFAIGITDLEQQFFTVPLQLSKEERWYSLKFEGRIPREGSTQIRIDTQDKVAFITVLSRYEENIQILHLVPTYSVSNNTSDNLTARSMFVYAGEIKVQLPMSLPVVGLLPQHGAGAGNIEEVPLLLWSIVKDPGVGNYDDEVACLQLGQDGYHAHPIILRDSYHQQDRRFSFTLPVHESVVENYVLNRAFLLTYHNYNGQVKLVIQKDPTPQLLIHNNTQTLLILGQSSYKEEGIMEEETDIFAAMPSVPPGKAVHYTFPFIAHKFPEIFTDDTNFPRLHFSQPDILNNAETEEVLWSQGVNIHQHYDQFVSIPGHGDVKVRIERVGHTTHAFVDPVSRVEVSARDIRSRIAAEPSKGRVATSTNKGRAMKEREASLCEDDYSYSLKEPNVINAEVVSIDSGISEGSLSPSSANVDIMFKVSSEEEKKGFTFKKVNKVIESKNTSVLYCTFMCTQISLLLKDDVSNQEHITEIIRVTLDNFIISVRPKIDLSEKLRALDYRVKEQTDIHLFIGDAQIDNQLFTAGKYDFPVILIQQNPESAPHFSPLDPIERAVQISHNKALFSLKLVIEHTPSQICLYSVHLKLKPISIYAEDVVFYSLVEILSSFLPVGKQKPLRYWEEKEGDETEEEDSAPVIMKLPQVVLIKAAAMMRPIHMTHLTIDPIALLLSVHGSVKVYLALDQTPLNFGAFHRSEILTTSYSLGHSLTMHYLSGALIRAGWVVGSLDLLGNPGGFARTVGSGVRDFVQLPYEGILQGPWAFIAGMTNGSLSLLKHLAGGTVVSLTNLASSVARNMERLSLDGDHAARSEAQRRTHPHSLTQGLMLGLSAFGISLLGAIGGLAGQPMAAFLDEGASASSFVGGVGKGLVGVVTKPIGGAADLLVHTGHALLQGAGWKIEQSPRFPAVVEPRSMGVNAPLKMAWKLLAALPQDCRCVHAAIEATHLTPAGMYIPVTILLTPMVLFILGVKEDTQQHALPLAELLWKPHPNDPTLLYLEKQRRPQPKMFNSELEPVSGCPERVADYVRSTCSEGFDTGTGLDSSDDEDDGARGDMTPGHVPRIKLYVAPRLRPALIAAINIAARASQGKGFII